MRAAAVQSSRNDVRPRIKVGDLVLLKEGPREAYAFLKNKPGICTDILEDDYGMLYLEVDFVDERGWFKEYEVELAGASVAKA